MTIAGHRTVPGQIIEHPSTSLLHFIPSRIPVYSFFNCLCFQTGPNFFFNLFCFSTRNYLM